MAPDASVSGLVNEQNAGHGSRSCWIEGRPPAQPQRSRGATCLKLDRDGAKPGAPSYTARTR